MIVEFEPGKPRVDDHDLALKLYREKSKLYNITYKYGTNRGIALLDGEGKSSTVSQMPGFYIIYGPKILGEMKIDLSESVPYYVGYAGLNNTMHVRIGRCIAGIMEKSYDSEPHAGADKIRHLLGPKVANLLSVCMMPYDIRDWEEATDAVQSRMGWEKKYWERVETALVRFINPAFNTKRV